MTELIITLQLRRQGTVIAEGVESFTINALEGRKIKEIANEASAAIKHKVLDLLIPDDMELTSG